MAGTNPVLAAMQILQEAGIESPGTFKVNNEASTRIIIRMVSAEVARVLRERLPEKGFTLIG